MSNETASPTPFAPPRLRRWVVPGAILGALLGATCGAWDAWATDHSPQRQDEEIRANLEGPHMDGPRFYARVYAVRYQSLESLLAWRGGRGGAIGGLVGGFGALFAWLAAGLLRERRARRAGIPLPPTPARGFTFIELLAVTAISSGLIGVFAGGPSGLVYYKGKDQTRWLMQLSSADAAERAEAVEAACHILDHHRCYGRETTVERLGKMGPEASAAIPTLRRLADREPAFREQVDTAIQRIEHPERPEPK
jgi:prepilin-type N-terminal cleavage/methylation domain-containing protein